MCHFLRIVWLHIINVYEPYRKEVPPLMCASLWPKFDLFKKYANSELILTKSAINQTRKDRVVQYM